MSDIADLLISNAEPKDVIETITDVMAKNARTVSVETLPTDFMIPGTPGLAIERKEMGDLMNTWFDEDERLSNQLETLKMLEEAGYSPALMIVGNMNEALSKRRGNTERKQMNKLSVTDLLMGVQLKWKIMVFRVEQSWMVPYTLKYLMGKVHGEKTAVPFRHTAAKVMTPAQKATYLVQGLPGVGVKTAEKIQQNTSDFMQFVNWLHDEKYLGEMGDPIKPIEFLTQKQKEAMLGVLEANWGAKK